MKRWSGSKPRGGLARLSPSSSTFLRIAAHCSGSPTMADRTRVRARLSGCQISVGEKERAQLVEVRGKTVDEQQSGFDHQLVISRFVLGEPCPIVVAF